MKNTDLNITFSKKYNIQNEEYENVKIITFPFSMRTHNCFKKAKILTIAALINFTPLELFKIRGFGKNCLNEVDLFCSKLSKRNNNYNLNKRQTKRATTSFIKKYDQEILRGDFKSIDKSCLNEIEKNYLLELQESYKILGEDLVCECTNNPKKISSVINVLSNFKMKISRMNEINEAYKIIPNFRRDNKVISYIKAFTNDNKERRKLRKMCFSENECISSFYGNLILVDFQKDYVLLLSFLNWCSFNLTEEIEKIFEILYSNEKIKYVIQSRARKRTLEYIGEKLGVTRERVRQIEANCINKFTNLDLRINIILKICAEENSEQIVGINNIEKYAGYYATDLIHLLKNSKNSQYTYAGQLNAFIIGDISVFKRFYRCIENLPDFINVCEESMLLYEISNKYTIPYELVNKVFLDIYKKTGSFYHKDRLSMGQVYSHVLKKYYPAGLNVYSDSMLDEFRLKVRNEFGDFELPINNRALTAGITNVCILCGRGVYRFNSHNFISKSLLHAIQKYIEDSTKTVFLLSSIFDVFKKELVAQGVTNRYFLQGILHDHFENKFTFRKDYISKDPKIKSFYAEVENFIHNTKYPVTKDQLKKEFPGITEIAINFVTKSKETLNFFGQYMASSNLIFLEGEKKYLFDKIEKFVRDREAHHIKDLYREICYERAEVFTRNSALDWYSAFSVLEYLFSNNYQFLRPYIALLGVEVYTPAEMMHNFIYSMDEVTIFEIKDFAKKNRFQIDSILDFVEECNDEYMLVNKNIMMKISKLGIDEVIAKKLEDILTKYVNKTSIIADLYVSEKLPEINVEWTDWLIYSVLKKWGTHLTVGISSTQFRYSIPLIAPKESFDASEFNNIDISNFNGNLKHGVYDDVDLIEEFIDEELLDYL